MECDGSDEDFLQERFDRAADYVASSSFEVSVNDRLHLYSRYKQAVEGDCDAPKPGLFDLQGKKKWNAWISVKGLSREDAMKQYIDKVGEMKPDWEEAAASAGPAKIGWVTVSTMMKERSVDDSEKTVFDFVQENNLERIREIPPSELSLKDENGMSPLHWACDRGHLDLVNHILEVIPRQEINAQDSEGQTPLHYAVSCSHESIIQILLNCKADVTIKDNEGNLPTDIIQDESVALLFVKH